ncbi:MAG: peptidoglycan -binding protein [Alphaproteobacteria bacterium]|nr:MAG: peptidoglycan -binding protein [Alphaproteobacteria bacterium]
MAALARRSRGSPNIWPGFVDALAALLMVIIFLLTVFMLSQFFLNELLSGRDEALARLERQISELSDLLSLERQASTDLRLSIAQLSDQLQSSTAERDAMSTQLAELAAVRDALAARAEKSEADAARVGAQLEDAFKVISADKEKIKIQLAELESLRRDILALRTVRKDLEAKVGKLAANLQTTERDLTVARDRSKALEARLASEQERTTLAQREIEKRDIRLSELLMRVDKSEAELADERELGATQRSRIALLARQIAALRKQLQRIGALLEASETRTAKQQVQIADLGRRLNLALAARVEELSKYRSEFFGRLREVLGDHPGIRVVGDRFVFQSEVLFASASAELNPKGEAQIARLATTLTEIGKKIPKDINWILRVDGHTDRVPIQTPAFPSNWELSTARAISVVKFLVNHGVPADRLAATGFGEHQPLDPRQNQAGYSRNRRIELKLTQR